MARSLWRKLLVHMCMSELYCPQCGGDVVAQGYNVIVCDDCGEVTYMESGNLAVEGKAHQYTGEGKEERK